MKQDERTGLWVPEDYNPKPTANFPPRLNVPDDAKGPTRITGTSPSSWQTYEKAQQSHPTKTS